MQHDDPASADAPIQKRADGTSGWSTAVPLLLLGVLAVMVLQSCLAG